MDAGASDYGEAFAPLYDDWVGPKAVTDDAVRLLAELAGGGPVLELAVGTGRIALPLADLGLSVTGLDASPSMLDRLRAKPKAERVQLVTGDMAETRVKGEFAVVALVFNSLFLLDTQEKQVRCFENAARHLRRRGLFVVEAFVPDMARLAQRQDFRTEAVTTDEVIAFATRHDPVGQVVTSQHLRLREDGTRLFPTRFRYAWPSELDLMARLAGLRLKERYGGWRRERFSADSRVHVSLWERA